MAICIKSDDMYIFAIQFHTNAQIIEERALFTAKVDT